MKDYRFLILPIFPILIILFCLIGGMAGEVLPQKTIHPLLLNLSTEILSVVTGNKTSFIAYVNNTGTETVKSVKISVEGIPSEWISVTPSTANITPGRTEDYLVIINVPKHAEARVYKLRVKATDDVESNVEVLTSIMGRDLKEIADLLLEELEKVRLEAKNSLSIEKCMDVTIVKTFYSDAEFTRERGFDEYENENYAGAINWFEYAITVQKKVVYRVETVLKMEMKMLNASKFIFPFYKPAEQFQLAETYLTEKNYERVCEPISNMRKFIMIGLLFWPAVVIFLIVLSIVIIILRRRKREMERAEILERVRERLRETPVSESQ